MLEKEGKTNERRREKEGKERHMRREKGRKKVERGEESRGELSCKDPGVCEVQHRRK